MDISKLDIVYTLKENLEGEELRYSLRSLKNFPHQKVWLYGGCPDWVTNVEHISVPQNESNKWNNASALLKAICENDNITEDFVWFNDDFFVLKEIKELPYYKDRSITRRTLDFWQKSVWAGTGKYPRRLRTAERALKLRGLPNDNYELHLPFMFNRKKLLQIFEQHPGLGAKRSLYGNNFVKDPIQRNDVKIYDELSKPNKDWDFVSTSDLSFKNGAVGKYIRNKFKKKGEYEQ